MALSITGEAVFGGAGNSLGYRFFLGFRPVRAEEVSSDA